MQKIRDRWENWSHRSEQYRGAERKKQIVEARKDGPFLSKEDLANRGKVSKTLIEYMTDNGVLKDLPDENQLSLFDML